MVKTTQGENPVPNGKVKEMTEEEGKTRGAGICSGQLGPTPLLHSIFFLVHCKQ